MNRRRNYWCNLNGIDKAKTNLTQDGVFEPDPGSILTQTEIDLINGADIPSIPEAMILAWELDIERAKMSASPWQFREALNLSELRDAVEQSVLTQSQKVKDGWQFATSFDRMNQWIIAMAYAMDITDEQLDDLFRLAMAQH